MAANRMLTRNEIYGSNELTASGDEPSRVSSVESFAVYPRSDLCGRKIAIALKIPVAGSKCVIAC